MKVYEITDTRNGNLVCYTWDRESWERTYLELTLASGDHFKKNIREIKIK